MKTRNSVLLAPLVALFLETSSALPAATKAKTTYTYTTIPVTTTYVNQVTTTVPVTISTSIKSKGTYTFTPNVVLTVETVPTEIKTTTYGTTVSAVIVISVYHTKVPGTAATATAKKNHLYRRSSMYGYAKSCSEKCALFDDCYAFEYLPIANLDATYPQNCWLYNKPFDNYVIKESTGIFFYDQSCFATVKGVKTPSYPKSKVCGVLGGVSTQNGRTKVGDIFAGNVDACAKYCLGLTGCQLYMYSEIEFQDGYNCHAYSSDWMAGSSLAGQPVATVEDMRSKNMYRIVFERDCASAV
ncbi:hypothetical protein TWF103_004856 [Orbilia oligospora]|uniref:Apple domain-containing protein n=1 Tax=Orbilia oligospora TaxID=2813651 RepID=A0A7C8K3Y6_ORBOL|nr:hypothetical protein TWF103_004856 [Orbilia oligospora]KAF3143783.1 hypothetical protein TWF703_010189 [Orbilia oligospora]